MLLSKRLRSETSTAALARHSLERGPKAAESRPFGKPSSTLGCPPPKAPGPCTPLALKSLRLEASSRIGALNGLSEL
jgi:hypothetical protein